MISFKDLSVEIQVETNEGIIIIEVLTTIEVGIPPVEKGEGEAYSKKELRLMGGWALDTLKDIIIDSEEKERVLKLAHTYNASSMLLTEIFNELTKKKQS